jgi:hypothetical protein
MKQAFPFLMAVYMMTASSTGYAQIQPNRYKVFTVPSKLYTGSQAFIYGSPKAGANEQLPTIFFPDVRSEVEFDALLTKLNEVLILPGYMVVGTKAPVTRLPEAAAFNPDALAPGGDEVMGNFLQNDLLPFIKQQFGCSVFVLGCYNSPQLTLSLLRSDTKTFDSYLSLAPLIRFRAKDERDLAEKYFSHFSYYSKVDLSKLSDEEKRWPDPVFVKMGLEAPIYFKE